MSLERGTQVSEPQQEWSRSGSDRPESGASVVEVRVAADATQLAVLRAVVGDLAMRADFDVDSIADLRLAVDEACSTLVRLAEPSAPLVCRFHAQTDEIAISAEVNSQDTNGPRQDTLSWRVLDALADSVSTAVEPDTGSDGNLVRVELSKIRAVGG